MGMGVFEGLTTPAVKSDPRPVSSSGMTKEGSVRRFRHDLPENVVTSLKEVAAAEPMLSDSRKLPRSHGQFKEILQSHAPIERMWIGPAYRFPDRIDPPVNVVRLSCENAGLLKGDFAKMGPELDSGRPCMAAIEGSPAVSICQSVRLSRRAHEAGVDTLEVLPSAWVRSISCRFVGTCCPCT